MLIQCPECELQASDKAISCPHCGYPFRSARKDRKKKRRRLPNGFGQITEIKDQNLRKPFRASVTIGKDDKGRCIKKLLKPEAYFETYNEAYAALVKYNLSGELAPDILMKDLYIQWTDHYFKTITKPSQNTIETAWRYCSEIYNMPAKNIRARHIKHVMETGSMVYRGEVRTASTHVKTRIKSLFNLMFDFALEYELVPINYARTFDISTDLLKEVEANTQGHIPYTQEEIEKLWRNVDKLEWVDVLLIQCYSGWRPQELGLLEIRNVDLNNWSITGGMKTEAGKNRIVPIHSRIRPLVEKHYRKARELGSEYLFNCTDTRMHRSSYQLSYDKWVQRLYKIRDMLELNPKHKAHDGRKHFVTIAKKYEVDEYAIKYIVGHSISDITEKVYTEREFTWLQSEIEKIK